MPETLCTCVTCGAEFVTPTRFLKRGRGRNCSRKCSVQAANKAKWIKHHANPESWFWNRVDRSGGPDACWPWLWGKRPNRGGYGRLEFKGKWIGAHRMALTLEKGPPISEDMLACHTCDNPICCNPSHLWWGTHHDNMTDMTQKGHRRGAPPKIDVDECVRLRATGMSHSQLGAHFGVSQSSIGKALQRASLRALSTEGKIDG